MFYVRRKLKINIFFFKNVTYKHKASYISPTIINKVKQSNDTSTYDSFWLI